MANNYKVKTFSNSATGTSQALFTASAATTLVKSVIVNCDKTTPNVNAILRIKKSGGAEKLIKKQNITLQTVSYEMLYDVLPLESGDALYAQSDDTDIVFVMSWVESTTSVIGQSIDVLSDVDTTGKANGDVLTYNSSTGNWEAEPSTGGNTFSTISVSTQSNVVADSTTDTLTLVAAGGMTITTNATTDTITLDSARLDDDDVTLSGIREINLNGENLNFRSSGFDILLVESDGVSMTDPVIRNYTGGTGGKITLTEATTNGSSAITIKAPDSLTVTTNYTLPSADGTSGQVLATDSTGGLSWATRSSLAFSTVAVTGQSNVVADSASDTLNLAAGSNITLTTDATTDTITIAASGGGTPAGSTGQIQYNNAGAFGAEAALYYDATNNRLSVGGNTSPTGTVTSRGAGTTTGSTLLCEDSGGSARFTVQDRGTMFTNERNDVTTGVHSFVFNATKNEYWRPTIAFKNSTFTSTIAAYLGDTNTLGYFGTLAGTAAEGGLQLAGACNSTASSLVWRMFGLHGSTAPTSPIIQFFGTKYAGSGSGISMLAALADSEPLAHFINFGNTAGTLIRAAILGSGAMGLRNTAPTSSTSLTVRGHGTGTGISLLVENSSGTARFTVRDDGAYAFAGGTVGAAQTGYTTFTNLTTDRTCDANATTVDELADILGTLIVDLKTKGIIAA